MKFNYIIIILLFVSLKSLCQISLPTFQGIHSGESCEIISNGLTIHYDVGNPNSYSGSGTRLVDLSGNGHDAILRNNLQNGCLLYTSPSPRDLSTSRMPSSA